MKKPLVLILAIAMLASLCACGATTAAPDDEKESTSQVAEVTEKEEEKKEEKKEEKEESTPKKEVSSWEVQYYVDDFGQPTKDGYVCNSDVFSGKFSNSATTDSALYANIVIDKDNVCIFLYEYGRTQVKNSSSYYDDLYNIKMKTADGKVHNLTGAIYCGDDRIIIDSDHKSKVIKALSKGGDAVVSFYIENAERPTTNYLFSVTSNDFAKQYKKLTK